MILFRKKPWRNNGTNNKSMMFVSIDDRFNLLLLVGIIGII